MIPQGVIEAAIVRAALAPSVHNTQPARWSVEGRVVTLWCDTDTGLLVGDPLGRDAALSCGAALEALVLAFCAVNVAVEVTEVDAPSLAPGHGLVRLAAVTITDDAPEPMGLESQLEARFTWRGPFDEQPVNLFGWHRGDARLVLDTRSRAWLAERNDWVSLQTLQGRGFRRELLSWMRLSDRHARSQLDGMNRGAMRMSKPEAFGTPLVLGPLWGPLNLLGATKALTSEGEVTKTAPVIALFHRPQGESPIESGRAYLRMCLEAASLGMAGWPMAALSDHPETNAEVCAHFGLPADRRLVQVIRFGTPTGEAPKRARRPLSELLVVV